VKKPEKKLEMSSKEILDNLVEEIKELLRNPTIGKEGMHLWGIDYGIKDLIKAISQKQEEAL